MCVCVCVKRLRRTTLPLNWVVGNTLLWQLLFAGPGAKNCFSLTLSLALCSFLCSSLLALPLSSPSSPLFSSCLCSSARFLSISCSVFLSIHLCFSFFSLTLIPSSLLCFPSVIPPFCLRRWKKQKDQASIIILLLNCRPQLQIEILI